MPRVKDIAWKFVIKLEGDKWRCPYCENECYGKVTRVKSHILKIPNRGISLCTKVPEHISQLMKCLHEQILGKDDITWRFVDRLENNRWRCYHCNEVSYGDLTQVKGHLLRLPNRGTSICPGVPDHVTTLMKSLLGEAAEEESREEAHGQSSVAPLSRDVPTEAEVAEQESREANRQFATEPQSRDMPTQAEVAEQESREANRQFATEPQPRDMPTHAAVAEEESREAQSQFIISQLESWNMSPSTDYGYHNLENFPSSPPSEDFFAGLENFLSGESISCPAMALAGAETEAESHLHDLPDQPQCSIPSQMRINDQQTPARASSFHYGQLPDVGNSNCLQDIDPSIASQYTSGCHISEAQNLELQVPATATNAIGPSSLQASVLPQTQSFPQPSTNHERMNAQQNPIAPSSSCNMHSVTCLSNVLDPHISPSSQALNNAAPLPQIPTYGTGPIRPYSSPDMNTVALVTSLQETAKNSEKNGVLKRKLKRLYSVEADIKDELVYADTLYLKKLRKEVENWLADVDKLRNDFPWTESVSEDRLPSDKEVDVVMREAEELITRESNFSHRLLEVRVTKFSKFLEEKMVGEAFQRNTTKILKYLIENQVSRLGIYGMGGVGKTTIMRYIHNRLLEKANYGNVFWVTVSQDFNPQKLQEDIWKSLDLGTLEEKDLGKRAAMLSSCLTERGKSTIILDDLWKAFDPKEVGIPVRADGFKLILTTRSFDVCCKMQCQEKIKIEPLSQEEAESLFFEELGSEAAFNSKIEVVAKYIVRECAGLPLGVITIARSLRGVTDMYEWEEFLEKLRKSDMGQTEMESKVLMNLKVSYDRLDQDVQRCFLSCALYPEDYPIKYDELIEFFIDQGFFDNRHTRKNQHRRGFTVLNKLKDVCLLEDDGRFIVMHDLIRDMALHIMSTTSIVKGGHELIRIPSEEYWTDALEKVSLMSRRNVQFSRDDVSPDCPKLSIFILRGSLPHDVVIPDSFFKHLGQLKILNLSGWHQLRELPSSISVLVNLRALLLQGCTELIHIPHLGELRSLRKLDVSDCDNLEELNGLGMLVNLRYLNLLGTKIEILPKGTLGGLKNLQWLLVKSVHVEDFANVWPLECFEGEFKDANDFNKFVRVTWEKSNPQYYNLQQSRDVFRVSVSDDARWAWTRSVRIDEMRDAIVIGKGESTEEHILILRKSTGDCILIPHDVQNLSCGYDDCITDLSGMYPLKNLEILEITEWEKLRVLCGGPDKDVIGGRDSNAPTTAPLLFPPFPRLTILKIERCRNLKYLFGHGSKFDLPNLQAIKIWDCGEMLGITAAVAPPPHPSPAFRNLTCILVWDCGKMKRVVEPEWLPHFPNLSMISVVSCDEMEDLMGVPFPYTPVEEMSFECLTAQDALNTRRLSIQMPPAEHNTKFFHVQVEQGQERSTHNATLEFPSFPSLENLHIHGCRNLKYLFGHGSKFDLPHLQSIEIWGCGEMLGITVAAAPPPPHPSPAFPSLTVIIVGGCGKMKRVVEPEWLPHFPKLSIISVRDCDEMTELIGVPPPYLPPVEEMSFDCLTKEDALNTRRLTVDKFSVPLPLPGSKFFRVQVEQGEGRSTHNAPSSSQSSISLPKLTYLRLYGMARLKSIGAPIFYDPMNVLEVFKCPGLSFCNCS